MKRWELEHVIRAASAITLDDELVVVGSQAILGKFPAAPDELLVSREADVFPKNKPQESILIDGAIGEGSHFHHTFGYYAHGVSPETAVLPAGWESRLVKVQNENTRGAIGWCLEPHDLAVSKLVAGREKDVEFVTDLLRRKMTDLPTIRERLMQTPLDPNRLQTCQSRLQRIQVALRV